MKCVHKGNKAWTNNGQFVLCPSNESFPMSRSSLSKDFARMNRVRALTKACIDFHRL